MSFVLESCPWRVVAPLKSNKLPTSSKTVRIVVRARQRPFHISAAPRDRQRSPVEQIIDQVNSRPKNEKTSSKVYNSADEAIADLEDGVTILSSGFGLCGVAGT